MDKNAYMDDAIRVVRQSLEDYTQLYIHEGIKLAEYQAFLANEYVKLVDGSKEFN